MGQWIAHYTAADEIDFPTRLSVVTPKVKGIWSQGNLGLLAHPRIAAIVGTRHMSRYGKQVIATLVPQLVTAGYVTVSGFMYGIDIEMHRSTILCGGHTIGVLGWGIDTDGIPENTDLYHKVIESDGLFISELPPQSTAKRWTFPQRNRIVVGLSDLVIVVEAGMKSGSLNSAAWALKMGKPVYAVPGPLFSPVSEGCNWLISQGKAQPMTLDFFSQKNYSKKVSIHQSKDKITQAESMLLTQLRLEGPQSLNSLARALADPVGEVSARLTILLLKGLVQEERGVWSIL